MTSHLHIHRTVTELEECWQCIPRSDKIEVGDTVEVVEYWPNCSADRHNGRTAKVTFVDVDKEYPLIYPYMVEDSYGENYWVAKVRLIKKGRAPEPEKEQVIEYEPGMALEGESVIAQIILDELTNYQPNQSLTKKAMKKLSELKASVRRTFSKDQKALWRTGRINDCGEWTEKAKEEATEDMVIAHLEANKQDMVERANEELDLEKEEEKN